MRNPKSIYKKKVIEREHLGLSKVKYIPTSIKSKKYEYVYVYLVTAEQKPRNCRQRNE